MKKLNAIPPYHSLLVSAEESAVGTTSPDRVFCGFIIWRRFLSTAQFYFIFCLRNGYKLFNVCPTRHRKFRTFPVYVRASLFLRQIISVLRLATTLTKFSHAQSILRRTRFESPGRLREDDQGMRNWKGIGVKL